MRLDTRIILVSRFCFWIEIGTSKTHFRSTALSVAKWLHSCLFISSLYHFHQRQPTKRSEIIRYLNFLLTRPGYHIRISEVVALKVVQAKSKKQNVNSTHMVCLSFAFVLGNGKLSELCFYISLQTDCQRHGTHMCVVSLTRAHQRCALDEKPN